MICHMQVDGVPWRVPGLPRKWSVLPMWTQQAFIEHGAGAEEKAARYVSPLGFLLPGKHASFPLPGFRSP